MKCKYKKFLKAAYINYEEDYCGYGSSTFTKPTVTTPIIVITGTTATIACAVSGATIYYTLDGSTPTSSSTKYTGAITLTQSCTIKAIAVKPGMTDSEVASEDYVHYLTQWKIVGNSEVHTLPYPDGVVLPTSYKRCKYLKFHGAECIDTGIIPEQGIAIDMQFSYSGTGEIELIGVRSTAWSTDSLYAFRQGNSGKMFVSYGGQVCSTDATSPVINKDEIVTITLDSQKYKSVINGSTFEKNVETAIVKGTAPLFIGDVSGYYSSKFSGKLYYVTISLNGVDIFNGIPCLDDNDVPCLYDTVSGTSFYNDGTGTFDYEIEPQPTEIWSCGEYSDVDNKYHIVVLPTGKQAVDIVLDEPLRKTGNTADTLEYPTETSGKALLTIRVEENGGELSPLDTPTTELVDAPQIEEADSYSMVISQGGKAVSWSSFETE